MGYDKPDLAFVIHYQSPGSPISYYQQVGRAGRALEHAHGVLLSGFEDRDIQDYFIRTAFPPQDIADSIVGLLADRGDWVKIGEIEDVVNIRRGRLTAMLKILEVEGAVARDGMKYRRTDEAWTYPAERIEHITAQRRAEQQVMADYVSSDTCLMELLGRVLDDPTASACGRCARCTGTGFRFEPDRELAVRAQAFLRHEPLTIDPRKRDAQNKKIPEDRRLETGRALCFWGDGGWGGLVRDQRAAGRFTDELVDATVRLVRTWNPEPRPRWIASVPSTRDPDLVTSFATRLAEKLHLPYHDVIRKTRQNAPQGEMENSAQQHRNVSGAFETVGAVPTGPVLLVDDVVSSRWTLTEIGAHLREAGSGPVAPLTLAQSSGE